VDETNPNQNNGRMGRSNLMTQFTPNSVRSLLNRRRLKKVTDKEESGVGEYEEEQKQFRV